MNIDALSLDPNAINFLKSQDGKTQLKFIPEKPTSQAVKSQHPWIRHVPL